MLSHLFNQLIRPIASALLMSLAAIGIAQATTGPWAQNQEAQVRLIAASTAIGNEERIQLGLEFALNPNWKIYWRSPGDAGTPPMLSYADDAAITDHRIDWPVPKRFSLFEIQTFGYGDHVILPIEATLAEPGVARTLDVAVDYLICDEICIPDRAELTLDLPAGPLTPAPSASAIEDYRRQVPGLGAEAGLQLASLTIPDGEFPKVIEARLTSDALPLIDPDLLIEAPEGYSFAPPEVRFEADGRTAILRSEASLMFETDQPLTLASVTATATDHGPAGVRGVEATGVSFITTSVAASASSVAPVSLLMILGIALLGGFILNLMPCVLPVLSLKMLSFVGKGGAERSAIRVSFLATALGIIASFLAIALVLVALKAAGASVGWGIQFQQPLFILALIAIIALFTANLFGGFEIQLPQWLGGRLGAAQTSNSFLGDFSTGAFATLLATPCSAPFLGTAISFALAQNAPTVLLVFAALGLGMALPYLAVIAFPALAQKMPRPGAWMVWLRRALGLLLVATIIWLLTVLWAQVGSVATIVAAALTFLLILALVLPIKRLGYGAIAAAVALLLLPPVLRSAPEITIPADSAWIAFDEAAIPARVAAGETVFVDVTADWCVTCKVNKAVVFGDNTVKALLNDGAITAMVADWTRPNADIQAYLDANGRAGIPFNIVYGPSSPHGIALPELVTPAAVLQAIDAAGGKGTSALASIRN